MKFTEQDIDEIRIAANAKGLGSIEPINLEYIDGPDDDVLVIYSPGGVKLAYMVYSELGRYGVSRGEECEVISEGPDLRMVLRQAFG